MEESALAQTAREIFGPHNLQAIERWVEYWKKSPERNRKLLEPFQKLGLIDFNRKKVLDIGCGAGGLAHLVASSCQLYVGADYHTHVLKFVPRGPTTAIVQCSATRLPFPDSSFDYIAAFDVIEHLVGGWPWQLKFMLELKRVLKPLGLILFTTPNRWYPYEGHSQLYFPQYLPTALSDRYLAWRRPGFLDEHKTFAEISLLTPARLRRALSASGLSFLHDLPCGLDRSEYRRLFPGRAVLTYAGLGWYPHAEFWGLLGASENRRDLRLKLRKNWSYEKQQPSPIPVKEFLPGIDFDQGPFGHQLGKGWHWHESDRYGFRWTSSEAHCYLQTEGEGDCLELTGYSPGDNRLEVLVDGRLIGQHHVRGRQNFKLKYLVPRLSSRQQLIQVTLKCSRTQVTAERDRRELGLMIFSLGLAGC